MSNKMNDLISKQEAIDALENIFNRCEEIKWHLQDGDPDKDDYEMYPDYLTVWKYLNQNEDHGVDTIRVVHGRWIPQGDIDIDGNQNYQCSICRCGEYHSPKVVVRYCWNCGARMEESDECNI